MEIHTSFNCLLKCIVDPSSSLLVLHPSAFTMSDEAKAEGSEPITIRVRDQVWNVKKT